MKRTSHLTVPKVKVFSEKERYPINPTYLKFTCGCFKMAGYFNFLFFNRKMPSVYHEHCGKPGPKSNDYVPPPEARYFKSRSAPNSPLMGERRSATPRDSPRLAREVHRLCEKVSQVKSPRSPRVGRSKSFNSKGMYWKNNANIMFIESYIALLQLTSRSLRILSRFGLFITHCEARIA